MNKKKIRTNRKYRVVLTEHEKVMRAFSQKTILYKLINTKGLEVGKSYFKQQYMLELNNE